MTFQPSTEFQLGFLKQLQRIFNEGEFVATYKFALLHALADICIERDAMPNGCLHIPLNNIGEKFIELYWHHAEPYGDGVGDVLKQNTKGQAQIVHRIEEIRQGYTTLAQFRRSKEWASTAKFSATQIKTMPLWKLQTMGGKADEFLYANSLFENGILLKPGVSFCLRTFYPMVLHLVRGHWVSHIRRIPANRSLVGDHSDLEDFLFGTQRAVLEKASPVLAELQRGACFYCGKPLRAEWQVDHFVPWARYPRDLGHNFVLAHGKCNLQKSDALAARPHIENWLARNHEHGTTLAQELGTTFLCDAGTSHRIAKWSYELDAAAAARLWLKARQYETCDSNLLALF